MKFFELRIEKNGTIILYRVVEEEYENDAVEKLHRQTGLPRKMIRKNMIVIEAIEMA